MLAGSLRADRGALHGRLAGLMLRSGVPEHIRSDNGPEFTARAVRAWLGRVGANARLYIEPGSPLRWENGPWPPCGCV